MSSTSSYLEGTLAPAAGPAIHAAGTLLAAAERDPKRLHLLWRDGRSSLEESARAIRRWAGWLRAVGLRAGDRVALLLPTSAEHLHIDLAAQLCGGITVAVTHDIHHDHLRAILADAQPRFSLIGAGAEASVSTAFTQAPVVVDEQLRADVAAVRPADEVVEAPPGSAARFAYDLVDTGDAVQRITHGRDSLSRATWRWVNAAKLTPCDVLEVAVPLTDPEALALHAAGLIAGSAVALDSGDSPSWEEWVVPGTTLRVVDATTTRAMAPPPRHRPTAPLAYDRHARSGVITAETRARRRPGSAGWASCGFDLEVVDASGEIVPVGASGSIAFRPSAAGSVGQASAWHTTRDRGRVDADGFLWLVEPD